MKTIIRTAETHPLTWRLRDDKQPVWLDEYRSKNGYEGARKALSGMAPDEIVNAVKDAGLKGRGGAGFSTGLKWSLMPKDESMNIRYLLCNADEMEPGTYKDRLLMEQLPHLLVEGMLISAFALKAYRGYIFLRGEYIEAAQHLRRAIAEATEAGLLGKNILGTGFDFELFVYTGAGRYICGEETALSTRWKAVALTRAPSRRSRRAPAYGVNRPASTTLKPCATSLPSSPTAWSGTRIFQPAKMPAPS